MTEDPIGERLGTRLRLMRKKAQLTQTELGDRAGGIAAGELSRFENGHRTPNMDTLLRLADALNVTAQDLLDFDAALPSSSYLDLRVRFKHLREQPEPVVRRVLKVLDAVVSSAPRPEPHR